MKATLLFVACLLGIVSPIAAAVSVEQDAYHVTIRSFDGVLVIRPLSDSAMRVRYSVREVGGEKSEILLDDLPAVRFSVVDTAQSVIVRTARMSASFDKAGGNISFFDASGRPLASEKPKARFVRASTLDGESCLSVGTSFSLSAGETLYGTGQFQDGQLVINDLPRHLLQENTQIAVPFVLSSKGYGILWHNTGATEFNMEGCRQTFSKVKKTGKTRRVEQWLDTGPIREDRPVTEYTCIFKAPADGRYGILLESGTPLSYEARLSLDGREIAARGQSLFVDLKAGKHTFVASATGAAPSLYIRSRDSQFSMASPVADALDYVVFAGTDPDDVVAAYRLVTGAVPMLPEWAYGFIQCRERYQTQQELLDSLAGFRSRGLPLDGIVQDWQYWGKYGWNAMQFDEANYPDPAGMVKAVHENNAHIMISVWSNLAPTSDIGQEFTGNGFFIPGTNWIDFFNPEAADAYWQHIDKTFNSIGFDAWWLDATEPERDQLHGRTVFTGQGDRVRNIYPLMVSRSVYTGQRASSPEKRVFILTRSAFSGQQRYASCVWSGDINANWDVFRRQIPAGQNYVATGMPYWTTDAGGFFRPEDQYKSGDYAELFIRWLQFATFTPLQRVHGSGSTTEPWNYGKLVEKEQWKCLYLRYRLLPYIYSTAAEVTFSGASMMRPLVMDYASDAAALDQPYEFLFGKSFLVAPVVQPQVTKWSVYLPATRGGWYGFFTGERHPGGARVEVGVKLDTIPLFVKAGSVIPLGPALLYTSEKPQDPIEIRVYPGADGDFTLYEDDGATYGYESGAFAKIPMHWNDAEGTLTIGARSGSFPGMMSVRHFRVVKIGGGMAPIEDSSVTSVLYDGTPVTVTPSDWRSPAPAP